MSYDCILEMTSRNINRGSTRTWISKKTIFRNGGGTRTWTSSPKANNVWYVHGTKHVLWTCCRLQLCEEGRDRKKKTHDRRYHHSARKKNLNLYIRTQPLHIILYKLLWTPYKLVYLISWPTNPSKWSSALLNGLNKCQINFSNYNCLDLHESNKLCAKQ